MNFLESDNRTKTLAKPQLRGTEGKALTLNLGSQYPVLSTVFGAPAAGGFATIPQSSYNYKDIGVNLAITPTVTYDGEVVLDLSVENTAIGSNVDVGGQSAAQFTSRKVHTFLRLREGEPSLLAGLIKQDNTKNVNGFPGLIHVPGFRQLLSNNDDESADTDIVMLITPHIVRDHELTASDVASIYIGTQANVGLSGPPQLIAPQSETPPPGGATPAPATGIPSAAEFPAGWRRRAADRQSRRRAADAAAEHHPGNVTRAGAAAAGARRAADGSADRAGCARNADRPRIPHPRSRGRRRLRGRIHRGTSRRQRRRRRQRIRRRRHRRRSS